MQKILDKTDYIWWGMPWQKILDAIKEFDKTDYIWWGMPWPKKEECDPDCWYPYPEDPQAMQKRCRGCAGPIIPNPILSEFMEKHKDEVIEANAIKSTYISSHFRDNKNKILIAVRHDVSIYKEDDVYTIKNPKHSIQERAKPIDVFNSIPSNIKRIYQKNLAFSQDVFKAVPSGLSLEFTETLREYFPVLSKREKQTDNLLLLPDWADYTNTDRPMLRRKFEGIDWVTYGTGYLTDCLDEIFNHKFCLAPKGNAADPHRIWECLYSGTIPIIEKSPELSHFDDLPILQVDSWDEITKEFLQEKAQEMYSKTYPMYKLKMGYWFGQIQKDTELCKQI